MHAALKNRLFPAPVEAPSEEAPPEEAPEDRALRYHTWGVTR